MKDVLEAAIKELAKKSKDAEGPNAAMQFSQAALNLAHALATEAGIKAQEKNSY